MNCLYCGQHFHNRRVTAVFVVPRVVSRAIGASKSDLFRVTFIMSTLTSKGER